MAWEEDSLMAQRRLPAGRRERLHVPLPAVVSVEAGTVSIERASLPAWLAAAKAEIVVHPADGPPRAEPAPAYLPYRPRPRNAPPPPPGDQPRDRIAALSGAFHAGSRAQRVEMPAEESAAEIVSALRRWGYLG